MKKYIAIDQGTTSSRAIIFDQNFIPLSQSQVEYKLSYPQDGWVEVDPQEILNTVIRTTTSVLDEQNSSIPIACGITNQRETTIVWNKKSGEPIYPAIIWQDRRTKKYCDELKEKGFEGIINKKTGLVLDPYFSATKIKWILDNVEGARKEAKKGNLLFGTVDSFLLYNLSEESNHFTDVTNASRTMLFNIENLSWDEELLELFDIPLSMMPTVKACNEHFGSLSHGNKKIPINGMIGDQQGALVGQQCFNRGDMKSTYGTGCFIMVNTKQEKIESSDGLLTTIGYQLKDQDVNYALEGSIYSCGTIVQWLRDGLNFFKNSSDSEDFLSSDGNSNGVKFLPAFNGLGAPHWNSDVRAGFDGITQDNSKKDLINAAFKAICFQTREILELLEDENINVENLFVDGGMVNNKTFCQLLSNVLEKDISLPKNIESTALGAAVIAQLGSGSSLDSLKTNIDKSFQPESGKVAALNKDFQDWKSYIQKSL